MQWTLETIRADGMLQVVPRGELDLLTAPLLARTLLQAEREAPARIRVDLTGLTFMDSSGLAVLLEAVTRSRARGAAPGAFDIRVDGGVVLRVLTLANLVDDLPLVHG